MPDWSYRTLLQPALFALGPERAQRVAVRTLSILGSHPFGLALIDFMGHMHVDPRLEIALDRLRAAGPVGLTSFIDPAGIAAPAFSRFGAGFVEVGPVAHGQRAEDFAYRVDRAAQALRASVREGVVDAGALAVRLGAGAALRAPCWVRLAAEEPAACARAVHALCAHAAAFVVDSGGADSGGEVEIAARVAAVAEAAGRAGGAPPVLLALRADHPRAVDLGQAAVAAGAAGVFVRGEIRDADGRRLLGRPAQEAVLACTRALRAALPGAIVIVAGGVLEPDGARQRIAAGAQLTAIDAGLIFSGPGLAKRCNEALLLDRNPSPAPEPFSLAAARRSFFWALMLGVAMLLGGMLAFAIASTRVVLPYDESLCGMTRAQLASLNPRLLPFMAHDRVTLAGSMLSIGVLYSALAWNGVRRGQHWAQVTVVVSAVAGFLSFFLFLGFGYFDPFHAFVTAVLFQFVLLALITADSPPAPLARADHHDDAPFRRAQWGQLLFIAIGIGLLATGVVITVIGCTDVFVRTDLEFLRTTAASLLVAHERLVPLVAHDRASLGGMLISNGLAVWLSAQWGLRAGALWLWRALALGGHLAFASAIGVHFVVGYMSLLHLAPAFAGWALWCLALWLTRGWVAPEGAGAAHLCLTSSSSTPP